MNNKINNTPPALPATRREFLKLSAGGIGLLALGGLAPSLLVKSLRAADAPAPASPGDRRVLVLVQLVGGNDGLNTVIPFTDAQYYKLRPTLAIPKDKVLRLTDTIGLHPACAELAALYKDGKLGIVQNVGYPNPNHSHFRSMEIWETATDSDKFSDTGWIGRFMDNTARAALDAAQGNAGVPPADEGRPDPRPDRGQDAGRTLSAGGTPALPAATSDPDALHLTNETPQTFLSAADHNTFGLNPSLIGRRGNRQNLEFLETLIKTPPAAGASAGNDHDNDAFLRQTMMDALMTEKNVQRLLADYKPAAGVAYPQNTFAQSFRSVAGLIAANLPTRVYFVSLASFDTHANQAPTHENLLRTLSGAMSAFQKDIEAHGLAGQVLTMTFSEFGRRPMENESKGTDHGTAAPLFVMGSKIKAGLHGTSPSLKLERNQDLTFSTDFRQVYATALEHWFRCPSKESLLGGEFKPLGFV